MSQGNAIADSLVGGAHVTETMHFHSLTHTNAGGLCSPFPITNKQARQIVQTCPTCQILNAPQTYPEGVNPRGLILNALWQMDVTHIPSFGRLSFVHVTIDTASGFLVVTAQSAETTAHAIRHLFVCFFKYGASSSDQNRQWPYIHQCQVCKILS